MKPTKALILLSLLAVVMIGLSGQAFGQVICPSYWPPIGLIPRASDSATGPWILHAITVYTGQKVYFRAYKNGYLNDVYRCNWYEKDNGDSGIKGDEHEDSIRYYKWDFGDGSETTYYGGYPQYPDATHVYTTPGTYVVTLSADDIPHYEDDPENSGSLTVNVLAAPTQHIDGVNGDDSNDGLSWNTAKKTIQAGIDAAVWQVWVKAGTYNERITLRSNIQVLGGFNGGETHETARTPFSSKSIIDGQQLGTVVTVPVNAVDTKIDGFTIRNGCAPGGGGIRCEQGSNSIISNNIITNNTATEDASGAILGGGICVINCDASIDRNYIENNTAGDVTDRGYGGGIYTKGNYYGWVNITNNIIRYNTGGGLYIDYPTATNIINNTIIHNEAPFDGAGIYYDGSDTAICNNILAYNQGMYDPETETYVGNGGIYITYYNKMVCICSNNLYNENYFNAPPSSSDIFTEPLLGPDGRQYPDSPTRDAGSFFFFTDDAMDIDSQPRCDENGIDIGADEFHPIP
jgi:hypothetical protein